MGTSAFSWLHRHTLVPELMSDLFNWMNKSRNTIHPLILASVFHYEFVFIHPFSDGNGRMARAMAHSLFSQNGSLIFEYIPIESQIEKFQTEYYDAIAQCHRAGSSTGFIEFMLSQIDKILDDIPAQINEENHLLSDYVQ
ncbi:MAG: Fic family protein [Blautia faecis]